MELSATLTETELRELVALLIPLRIDISGDDDKQRWLDIDELLDAELVPDDGFVVTARASLRWPERNVFDELEIERVEVVIEPRLEPTPEGVGVAVIIRCRDVDLRWVPAFVDRKIVDAVNQRLRRAGVEFHWNLSSALRFEHTSEGAPSNITSVALDVGRATLRVEGQRVHLRGPMDIRVVQQPPHVLEQSPQPALPVAR